LLKLSLTAASEQSHLGIDCTATCTDIIIALTGVTVTHDPDHRVLGGADLRAGWEWNTAHPMTVVSAFGTMRLNSMCGWVAVTLVLLYGFGSVSASLTLAKDGVVSPHSLRRVLPSRYVKDGQAHVSSFETSLDEPSLQQ
jgi:hypothetical protein